MEQTVKHEFYERGWDDELVAPYGDFVILSTRMTAVPTTSGTIIVMKHLISRNLNGREMIELIKESDTFKQGVIEVEKRIEKNRRERGVKK